MAILGKVNPLKVVKEVEFGLYLDGGSDGEILLPKRYVPENVSIGDVLSVFIYNDSEDRIIATTEKPFAMVGEFAFLEVVDNMKFGSFVDIGLPKHILVPKNKQKGTYEVGKRKVLQLQLDDRTNRLIASEKYDLLKSVKNLEKNDSFVT